MLLFLLLVITACRLELFSSLSYQNSAHPVPLCSTEGSTSVRVHAHSCSPSSQHLMLMSKKHKCRDCIENC